MKGRDPVQSAQVYTDSLWAKEHTCGFSETQNEIHHSSMCNSRSNVSFFGGLWTQKLWVAILYYNVTLLPKGLLNITWATSLCRVRSCPLKAAAWTGDQSDSTSPCGGKCIERSRLKVKTRLNCQILLTTHQRAGEKHSAGPLGLFVSSRHGSSWGFFFIPRAWLLSRADRVWSCFVGRSQSVDVTSFLQEERPAERNKLEGQWGRRGAEAPEQVCAHPCTPFLYSRKELNTEKPNAVGQNPDSPVTNSHVCFCCCTEFLCF